MQLIYLLAFVNVRYPLNALIFFRNLKPFSTFYIPNLFLDIDTIDEDLSNTSKTTKAKYE